MNKNVLKAHIVCGMFLVMSMLEGCTTSSHVVPATYQELQAAKAYKKSIAILGFYEDPNEMQGVESIAVTELERLLVGHFDLVEGVEVRRIIRDNNLYDSDQDSQIKALADEGQVDYVVMGTISASLIGPQIESSEYKDEKEDRFHGEIWEEIEARATVAIKIIDSATSEVVYADKKYSPSYHRSGSQYFEDEHRFKKTLRMRQIADAAVTVIGMFAKLDQQYSAVVADSIRDSVKKFKKDILRNFPNTGEILEILSEKEVVVNLGSAYGVKPGNKLIVFKQLSAIKDPKTTMVTIPKEKKAKLKVKKVTSGLTCIAKGRKKDIANIRVGDKVFTQ